MTVKKATLIGMMAILLWSAIVGLIRLVSEGLGAIGGAAMIYTLGTLMLLLTVGFPRVRHFPRVYLILGSLLFVLYELCLSLSLGFAHSGAQAIQVGMVNYLWPGMTIVLSVVVNQQPVRLTLIPGMLLSLCGVCLVLGGEHGLSLAEISASLRSNPLSFALAFSGAIIWAVYCVLTKRFAQGNNGITLFFMLTALTLWVAFSLSPQPAMHFTLPVVINLALATIALGMGYAAWNTGILHGNVTVLASASYFIPVISAALAAVMLQSPLTLTFWQGAAMVSLGSLICWWASRENKMAKLSNEIS